MKWLQFFRKKRKKVSQDGASPVGTSSDEDEDVSLQHKRREACQAPAPRPSLDQWYEARRARTCINTHSTTTTEKLTVCKAGVTTLINRTYIVIKHLGSGTYGQVALAFNIRDKKLYAIKLCRKSQYGAALGSVTSPRCTGLSKIRRSLNGFAGQLGGLGPARAMSAGQVQNIGVQPGNNRVNRSGMILDNINTNNPNNAGGGCTQWGRATFSGCPVPSPPSSSTTPSSTPPCSTAFSQGAQLQSVLEDVQQQCMDVVGQHQFRRPTQTQSAACSRQASLSPKEPSSSFYGHQPCQAHASSSGLPKQSEVATNALIGNPSAYTPAVGNAQIAPGAGQQQHQQDAQFQRPPPINIVLLPPPEPAAYAASAHYAQRQLSQSSLLSPRQSIQQPLQQGEFNQQQQSQNNALLDVSQQPCWPAPGWRGSAGGSTTNLMYPQPPISAHESMHEQQQGQASNKWYPNTISAPQVQGLVMTSRAASADLMQRQTSLNEAGTSGGFSFSQGGGTAGANTAAGVGQRRVGAAPRFRYTSAHGLAACNVPIIPPQQSPFTQNNTADQPQQAPDKQDGVPQVSPQVSGADAVNNDVTTSGVDGTSSESLQSNEGQAVACAGAPPVFRKRLHVQTRAGGAGAGVGAGGEDGQQWHQIHVAGGHGLGTNRQSFDGGSSQRRRAEEWVREIAIMKKLSHPNIVRLVEVIDDPGSDNLLLVMEYVEGMSLHPNKLDSSHWERVPEHEAWRRARDVLQGLDYLHYHGVVHGDLKPANLMLDNNTRQVKIVDFGSAMICNPGGSHHPSFVAGGAPMSCTPAFRSPESLKSGYKPSYELDMWAIGVTIYMWVFGQLPFNGAAPFLIYENIRRKELALPQNIRISAELQDFLNKVLNKDATQRLDVVAALNHPWVTGNNTTPLPIIQRGECGNALSCLGTDHDAVVLLGNNPNGCSAIHSRAASGQLLNSTGQLFATTGQLLNTGGSLGFLMSTQGDVHSPHHGPCASGDDGKAVSCPATNKNKRHKQSTFYVLSQEEMDMAISKSLGGHAISELMGMLFVEVHLPAQTQIIKAGDPVDSVYLITQGEVEIYQELPPEETAAAAALLGCPNSRSRILATVIGPPSLEQMTTLTDIVMSTTAAEANLSTVNNLSGGQGGGGSGLYSASASRRTGQDVAVLSETLDKPNHVQGGGVQGSGNPVAAGVMQTVPLPMSQDRERDARMRHGGDDDSSSRLEKLRLSESGCPVSRLSREHRRGRPALPALHISCDQDTPMNGPPSFEILFPPGGDDTPSFGGPSSRHRASCDGVAQNQQRSQSESLPADHPKSPFTRRLSSAMDVDDTETTKHVPVQKNTAQLPVAPPTTPNSETPAAVLSPRSEQAVQRAHHAKQDYLLRATMSEVPASVNANQDLVLSPSRSSSHLTAAATSLSQPIISGLAASGSGYRQLIRGPHISGVTKQWFAGVAGERSAAHAEVEEEMEDMFLNALLGPLPSLENGIAAGGGHGVTKMAPGQAYPHQYAHAVEHGPMKLSRQHTTAEAVAIADDVTMYGSSMACFGVGNIASRPRALPVVVLAVKGPGDTLGFASIEYHPDNDPSAAAAQATSVTDRTGKTSASSGQTSDVCGWGGPHRIPARQASQYAQSAFRRQPSLLGPGGRAGSRAQILDTDDELMQVQAQMQAAAAAKLAAAHNGNPNGSPDGVSNQADQPGVRTAAGVQQSTLTTIGESGQVGTSNKPSFGGASAAHTVGADAANAGRQQQEQEQPIWRANVRTKTAVVAFKANVEHMQKLCKEFPELEASLKHLATQQETDLLVSEALRQLRLVSVALHTSSDSQHASEHTRPGAAAAAAVPSAQTQTLPTLDVDESVDGLRNSCNKSVASKLRRHAAMSSHSAPAQAVSAGLSAGGLAGKLHTHRAA